jgi:GNAT superfamily N-acetyltransferase
LSLPEDSTANIFLFAAPQNEADWVAYYDLRWRVLRQPWGQAPGSERDPLDTEATHCLARLPDGQVVGCGRLHFIDARTASIRFMAVEPSSHRLGIGSGILNYLEQEALKQGMHEIQLDARETALPFYLDHGYKLIKMSHVLFGEIQHFLLKKQLNG